jgi:hypothetical protein
MRNNNSNGEKRRTERNWQKDRKEKKKENKTKT